MKLCDFHSMIHEWLDFPAIKKDASQNGLQVGDFDSEVNKVAFAVDASLETFRRAKEAGADLVFVHHGLFWSQPVRLVGQFYQRIRYLIENKLALYAVHLPLDRHPELGNNICIARRLGLNEIEPFGEYHGMKIGYKGRLPEAMGINEIAEKMSAKSEKPLATLPFGPGQIRTIGIVSGDDPRAAYQAIDEGLDLFITGDAAHIVYHEAMEAGLNVIFGGHYATEIWGVQAVAKKLAAETSLESVMLDIPTGL
ncbi:MAG: Nif3-like dinuclear metal center hexameric protein [Spirochaetales bacterium]|nr:Nif3-like dinuclear metal center hexameric protein [Spirochaetales bacterium]